MLRKELLLAAAADHGTPVYIYDLRSIRARQAELVRALPPAAALLYSVKANPLLPIVAEVRAGGGHAEVSSTGELGVAMSAGFSPTQILYTGPGKSRSEIHTAICSGVRCFSCESLTELARLQAVGSHQGHRLEALLRVQPTGGHRPVCL